MASFFVFISNDVAHWDILFLLIQHPKSNDWSIIFSTFSKCQITRNINRFLIHSRCCRGLYSIPVPPRLIFQPYPLQPRPETEQTHDYVAQTTDFIATLVKAVQASNLSRKPSFNESSSWLDLDITLERTSTGHQTSNTYKEGLSVPPSQMWFRPSGRTFGLTLPGTNTESKQP